MIPLTKQSESHFKEWLYSEYDYKHLTDIYPSHLGNYLVIEFFDSKGIYISIKHDRDIDMFYCSITHKSNSHTTKDCFSRDQAVESAITIANTIYNLNNYI